MPRWLSRRQLQFAGGTRQSLRKLKAHRTLPPTRLAQVDATVWLCLDSDAWPDVGRRVGDWVAACPDREVEFGPVFQRFAALTRTGSSAGTDQLSPHKRSEPRNR